VAVDARARWVPVRWHRGRASLYVAPALAIVAAGVYLPFLAMLGLSVFDWNLVAPRPPFVGLANYRALWQDPRFVQALTNTGWYLAGLLPVLVALPLVVASALFHLSPRATAVYRPLLFLPAVISFSVASLIWLWILNPLSGPLVPVFQRLGAAPPNWLAAPASARWGISAIVAWRFFGQNVILYLAGFANLSRDVIEAARIDGASEWQVLLRVSLPLLRPTVVVVGIFTLSAIATYSFVPIQILTQGGPFGATTNVVYAIWQDTFDFLKIGAGATVGVVVFVLFLAAAAALRRLLERVRLDEHHAV